MIRIFVAILLVATPGLSNAEPLRVSAGEHSEFTRIVLEHPELPQWQARRRGSTYRLIFSSVSPLNFDLSRVFRLIDRSRVGDIRAVGGNVIEFDVVCQCDVRPVQNGESALVLDVWPVTDEPPDTQPSVADLNTPLEAELSPLPPATESMVPELAEPATVQMPELPVVPSPVKGFALDFEPSELTGQASVELLGRALSRAATQGLVSAEEAVDAREGESTLQQLRSLGDRLNLSVTTSFDRATLPDTRALPPTESGGQCLADRYVNVVSWGDVEDKGALGRIRGAAISENGSVDPNGIARLARFYIHLGFGAEAKVAAEYMETSREKEVVQALADVVDLGSSVSSVLQGQAACQGKVALWSILAQPLTAASAPRSVSPALAEFSALPSHLRTHLGPLLSERLHSIGFHEEARTAINALTRGGIKTEESELATARLELEGTHADKAREALTDLSNGTNLTAAAALFELLLDAEERGMAPNPAWVDDTPTLVGALEGTEVAERLNVAGLRGKIALGRFDDFRTAIVEDTPGLNSESRKELVQLALRKVLETGSDTVFLKSEVGLVKILPPRDLPREVRRGIADRLYSLGLPRRALAYIDRDPEAQEDLETAVRVLIASGHTETALATLERSALAVAADLRARTLVAAGRDDTAMSAFFEAGDMENADSAAMRVAEWAWLAENGNLPLASAARILSSSPIVPEPVIENPNGTLIDALRERRQSARSLLELTQPSDGISDFTN